MTSSTPLKNHLKPLILLWGFPEPTQTFIHRELLVWREAWPELHVLAGTRRKMEDTSPGIQALKHEAAFFLPAPLVWFVGGLAAGLTMPERFLPACWRMLSLPHRTWTHRLRAFSMTLAAAYVRRRVVAEGIDYLHAHFGSYPTEWAMALSWMTGIPYGVSAHAVDIWKDDNILSEKIAESSLVFTCTRHNWEHLQSRTEAASNTPVTPRIRTDTQQPVKIDAGKIVLAYHGLDWTRYPAVTPTPGIRKLTAVGRLVPKKGFGLLLSALAVLKQGGVNAELDLIGEGPERKILEGESKRLGLAEAVHFRGAMPNAEVLTLLSRSEALVMPSQRAGDGNIDGIPNVILEAMGLGRPVVGSNFSGIPEAVTDGETGWLFPPGDVEALATCLRELFSDPCEAARRGAAAAADVRKRFDVRINARMQLIEIQEKLGKKPILGNL